MALIRCVIFSSTYWCHLGLGPVIVSINHVFEQADTRMYSAQRSQLKSICYMFIHESQALRELMWPHKCCVIG